MFKVYTLLIILTAILSCDKQQSFVHERIENAIVYESSQHYFAGENCLYLKKDSTFVQRDIFCSDVINEDGSMDCDGIGFKGKYSIFRNKLILEPKVIERYHSMDSIKSNFTDYIEDSIKINTEFYFVNFKGDALLLSPRKKVYYQILFKKKK